VGNCAALHVVVLSSTLKDAWCVLLQRFDLIRDFPGQGHVPPSYMPIGRQLLIKTALAKRRESTQPELSPDTGETEVKIRSAIPY